jgi:hypothetical protein
MLLQHQRLDSLLYTTETIYVAIRFWAKKEEKGIDVRVLLYIIAKGERQERNTRRAFRHSCFEVFLFRSSFFFCRL